MTSKTLPAGQTRRSTKGRTFPRDPIVAADMALILDVCIPVTRGPVSQLVAARDRALLIMGWRAGLRIAELLAVEPRDLIDSPHRAVFVRRGKGGKQRFTALDLWGWDEIQKWARIREELPSGPLFCQIKRPNVGSRLSYATVRDQFVRMEERAGLTKRLRPHQLRHGMALEGRREGWDYGSLQAQLGHEDIGTTARYCRELDPWDELQPVLNRPAPMIPLR
jgi:site-specific recombinase XerD